MMMTRHTLCGLMAALLSLATGAVHAQDNLIVNGTFGSPGPASLDNWTAGPAVFPGGGLAFFVGSPGSSSTLSQSVSTTAGVEHTLSFDYGKGGDWFRSTSINAAVYLASNPTTPIAQTGFLNPGLAEPGTDITDFFPASLTFTPAEGDIVVKFTSQLYATRVFPLIGNVVLTAEISDTDGYGIPDDEDACPDSDLSFTVVIDGNDSGVFNDLFDDGCTISDLISQCYWMSENHGEFMSCVSDLTNWLKAEGIISGKEKGAITKAAAKAF
jgi:hypothetical protein